MRRWAWLERDRAAFMANLGRMEVLAGRPLMAVVKANAYGHGASWAAEAAQAAGARALAVATAEEALSLRQGGSRLPILILGAAPPEAVADLVRAEVALTVHQAAGLGDLVARVPPGCRLDVHLLVDTGMHRLGVSPEEAPALAAELRRTERLSWDGIYTHLATADSDREAAQLQLDRFSAVLAQLQPRPKVVHALNSAGIFRLGFPEATLARPGIALYGLSPFGGATPPDGFQPVMRLLARAVQVHRLQAGEGVGYGFAYVAEAPVQVAVLPLGYADGYPRQAGGKAQVLFRGELVPVVGRISMDMLAVAVPWERPLQVGDGFTLIGREGGRQITADQVAKWAGTIGYDVTSGLSRRLRFEDSSEERI